MILLHELGKLEHYDTYDILNEIYNVLFHTFEGERELRRY